MQLVLNHQDHATTTSVLVAQKFEKEHKDVLRAIRELECSEEFSRRNFTPSDYEVRGKSYPMYIMTKDGFTLLVMSFTGSIAAKFKEDFINAFNQMEAFIKSSIKPPAHAYAKRILSEPTKSLPAGFWSVFDESHKVMMLVEKYIGTYSLFDLLDGSIGKRWAEYRREKDMGQFSARKCLHDFKDQRGMQTCSCYPNEELFIFRAWLENIYLKKHLPKYLLSKYEKDHQILVKVQGFVPILLARVS